MIFVVWYDCLLTCPSCGDQRTVEMPEKGTLLEYTCPSCSEMLRPAEGACCVFCSYGSTECAIAQTARHIQLAKGFHASSTESLADL